MNTVAATDLFLLVAGASSSDSGDAERLRGTDETDAEGERDMMGCNGSLAAMYDLRS